MNAEINIDIASSVLSKLKLKPESYNNPAMEWHIEVHPADDGFIVLGFPARPEADNFCSIVEEAIRTALVWATEPSPGSRMQ